MTPEQKDKELQQLNTAIEKNKAATTDLEKTESAASIAFRNMNLGNYKEAIKSYKQVIESDPSNFAALNNLAVMYEEMGDIDGAIKYIGMLYNLYTDNAEVNSDFVRLLIANKQIEEASRVVEAYKKTEKAKTNEEFIKSLEKEVEAARKKGTN
jgi:tetratricopeptide (TPR) repeat protein